MGLFRCRNPVQNLGMIYGYARVSTDGQSVDAQVRQLTKAGCKKVFREVASGAKTERAQLRRLLDQLVAADVVIVTRLDRLYGLQPAIKAENALALERTRDDGSQVPPFQAAA